MVMIQGSEMLSNCALKLVDKLGWMMRPGAWMCEDASSELLAVGRIRTSVMSRQAEAAVVGLRTAQVPAYLATQDPVIVESRELLMMQSVQDLLGTG